MSIGPLLHRAATLPPDVLFRKAWCFAARRVRAGVQRRSDRKRPTYAATPLRGDFQAYVALTVDDISDSLAAALPAVTAKILDHQFDLLGSGWTAVRHGVACAGIEGVRYPPAPEIQADREGAWLSALVNPANLAESRRLWRLVDQANYCPIDWQLDFKSGYRWSEANYSHDIVYGREAGADIKVPWELARMQHLPWLATACLLAQAGRPGFEPMEAYSREVRNQILDFIAANPPRFGVNWCCPMDVGIRIANWLLAIDILRCAGVEMDRPFRDALSRVALDHGRHIATNLEWSETGRSNHYLADIVGLLFVGAYLPCAQETDAWLAFAIQQLENEIEVQFGADGGNYEGSTAYHCLSAEIVLYAAALVLGLRGEKLSALQSYDCHAVRVRPEFEPAPMRLHGLPGAGPSPLSLQTVERIGAMADFLEAVTKPTGCIMQVGDTDSGRLFKLHPAWDAASRWDEDALDRRALSGAFDAFFGAGSGDGDIWLDARVIRSLTKGRTVARQAREAPAPSVENLSAVLAQIGRLPDDGQRVTEFSLPAGFDAAEGLSCAAFPDFGLFVLRGPRLFVSLRCARHSRPEAPSGHTHDDNLTMELQIDGRDVIVDPGSYLYTAFPEIREQYRAAAAHFVPRPIDGSAIVPSGGLFELRQSARATCLHCGPTGIAGRLDAPDWQAWRVIELLPGRIRVWDASSPGPLARFSAEPLNISNGYGKLTTRPAYSF